MIATISFKTILIMPVIVVLLGGVVPHTQRAFAQVDCNATPDDPSCQSSSSPPSQPSTQTCPDGSVIDASATCPTPPPPPQPSTQKCPDGSVIDASATCPTPTATTGSNNPTSVSCNPNDPNPPASCKIPSQPDSSGSCPSDTRMTNNGICCPPGSLSKHNTCETPAQFKKNSEISRQNACNFIGGVGSLVNPGLGKDINGASGLIGCK